MILTMLFTFFKHGKWFLSSVASVFLLLAVFAACKKDNALQTEDLLGSHVGTCIHYRKNLATGLETRDTTFDSILEFTKVDETYTSVDGCGAYNNLNLPEAIDTVYHASGFLGGQSYYWEIRISNLDKTIETTYTVTNPGGISPIWEQNTGLWHF